MKNYLTTLLLSLLFLGGLSVQAQTTFSVYQNITLLTQVGQCGTPNQPKYNGQSGTIMNVQVDVTHNITGGVSYVQNVNSNGYRTVRFRIFPASNGQATSKSPEATISKIDNWLADAVASNTSTNFYQLTGEDLQAAGVSLGDKVVKVSAHFQYQNFLNNDVDLFVGWGNSIFCTEYNFTTFKNQLECHIPGISGCFRYYPCDHNVNFAGAIQIQNTPWGPYYEGNYYALINGSPSPTGNYSYQWTMDPPISSSQSNQLTFGSFSNPNINSITLEVTDDNGGCVYEVTENYKNGFQPTLSASTATLNIGPNPANAGQEVKIDYLLPQEDIVSIQMYDLTGRMVAEIASDVASQVGNNTVIASTANLDAGIYFVRLQSTKSGVQSRKLMVTK